MTHKKSEQRLAQRSAVGIHIYEELPSMQSLPALPSQDNKDFKVSVREGSSAGSSSTDLKSKLLGERRDSSSDRYIRTACFPSSDVRLWEHRPVQHV